MPVSGNVLFLKWQSSEVDLEKTLDKDLCIKCHDANRIRSWKRQPQKERDWNRGRMACVKRSKISDQYYISIKEMPPHDCPYYLEHILLRQG
jgi:hypothetical protein